MQVTLEFACWRNNCWITFSHCVYSWLTPTLWRFRKGGIWNKDYEAGVWKHACVLFPLPSLPPLSLTHAHIHTPTHTFIAFFTNCQGLISYISTSSRVDSIDLPLPWCGSSQHWAWNQEIRGWGSALPFSSHVPWTTSFTFLSLKLLTIK